MMRFNTLMMGAVLAVVGMFLVGCSSDGPGRYDVNVGLDPAITSGPAVPTIAVNIIAASGPEAQRLSGMSMTKYWQPDSAERKELAGKTKEFVFGPGKTGNQMLSKSDPLWDTWKGADTLFVLANLPGGHNDAPGNTDNRRVELPLMKSRWESGQVIQMLVQRGKLSCQSTMKPVKQ